MYHTQYILKCEGLESYRRNKSSCKIALFLQIFPGFKSSKILIPEFLQLRLFCINDPWNLPGTQTLKSY